ncbi:hypothetical protein ACWEOP_38810, partial [Streptomyces chartreusis]
RTAALVGSTNFNRRSLDHDEEVMLAVLDQDFRGGRADADGGRCRVTASGRCRVTAGGRSQLTAGSGITASVPPR